MKAKPIFTIGIPNPITREQFDKDQHGISNKFKDYHVLVYSHNGNSVKFECFYEKDFNEVKFKELKQMVRKLIKQNRIEETKK